MGELPKRVITGLILASIGIFAVLYMPVFLFKIGISVVAGFSVWEAAGLLDKKYKGLKPVVTGIVGVLTSLCIMFLSSYLALLIIFLYGFYIGHKFFRIEYSVSVIFALIYGSFFVSSIGLLHQIDRNLLLVLFATIWSEDILAYFVGKSIGKNRLAPRLSPKKTWEGAIGGFLSAVFIGSITGYLLGIDDIYIPVILAAILGQIGDLFESFIKRQVGEKDSSHLIPGHGGILDRIDALMFGSVVFLIFYQLKYHMHF